MSNKGNPQKKRIFQDNFIKHWCCSAKNHPEGWAWWKEKNRKNFRRKEKEELRKQIEDEIWNEEQI